MSAPEMAWREGLLALADGSLFEGEVLGFDEPERGAAAERGAAPEGSTPAAAGEVVFNTVMTGYQEVLTDPSYAGQMISFTYPHIGNYGVAPDDDESRRPFCRGVIVRELTGRPSNWRAVEPLAGFLRRHGLQVISGVDTRRLTRQIRDGGAMPGAFGPVDAGPGSYDEASLLAVARAEPTTDGRDLVAEVTCSSAYRYGDGPFEVVAYDFGIKRNILRNLARMATVTVVPASTPAGEVIEMAPDGVFLSNGPGDPAAVAGATEAVRGLLGKLPVFGICLGHQNPCPGPRRFYLQIALWPPRRQPSRAPHRYRCGRNNQPEPQLRGCPRHLRRNRKGEPHKPERRRDRRLHLHRRPGVLGAVPPRGWPWAPRRPLPLRRVRRTDAPLRRYRSRASYRSGVPEPCKGASVPRRDDISSIMVIGSGPIVIGQACEFDYSGTQACRALSAEGYRVVLVNSNPATIMTDPEIADRTYIEPLVPEILEAVIARERPDALLPTLGGQTGLNLAMKLHEMGVLERYGVEMIGANATAIATAEDRGLFRAAMTEIGLAVPDSGFANGARGGARDRGKGGFPCDRPPVLHIGRRRHGDSDGHGGPTPGCGKRP